MQGVHRDFFLSLRHMQTLTTLNVPPTRGILYDRYGVPLALNTVRKSACVIPATIQDRNALERLLAEEAPEAYQRFLNNQTGRFLYIQRHLSPEKAALLNQKLNGDIFFIDEPVRQYLSPSLCSTLGITNSDHQGSSGLELLYNTELAGTPAKHLLSRSGGRGNTLARTILSEGIPGNSLTTTLDSTLQEILYDELRTAVANWKSESAGALIMDPETGDIYALVSLPTCDPNDWAHRSPEHLTNKTIIESFEFGSVMKVFPALAALDESVVTLDEEIDCLNTQATNIDGIKITTWKSCGSIPYRDVIALSNNIGTSKVTARLGKKLYEHLRRLGFGAKTGIAFPGEEKGYVMHPKQWSGASLFSLSFGYEIRATLLQLARAFSVFSNGGYLVTPRLLLSTPITRSNYPLYPPESIAATRECMERTITHGNAQRMKIPGITVLGKTGSANLIVDGAYDPNATLFSFACIVENNSYKRVIVTFFKKAYKSGILSATVTIPCVRKIVERMLIHENRIPQEIL
jgi:cell division protein FtsI (penicillin-binding protein 3)